MKRHEGSKGEEKLKTKKVDTEEEVGDKQGKETETGFEDPAVINKY